MSNPFEDMSVRELDELEKALGKLRIDIRKVQVLLRKIMETKGWRPELVDSLYVEGVPPKKMVGTPGG